MLLGAILVLSCAGAGAATRINPSASRLYMSEGANLVVDITAGPFDLHRKYRSMEGPFVMRKFKVGDLLASRHIACPESMVSYLEGSALSMQSAEGGQIESEPEGLVDASSRPRELVWFKGMELEVLDESEKAMPTAEFICHLNLDVDPAFRKKVLSIEEGSLTGRLMTLTQGQTSFYLPKGFAVPVATDETWTFTFQAANRTADDHRRVKHRVTLYFIEESQRKEPIAALNWFNPYIAVAVDEKSKDHAGHAAAGAKTMDCLKSSHGEPAPNTSLAANFKDKGGRWLSGHWVVPPGNSSWKAPIGDERDRGFGADDRRIHAVWSHVHPLCTSSSLLICDGKSRRKAFTARVKTKIEGGLELASIDDVISKKGITIPGGKSYELEAKYANPTSEAQDSMVALGVFFRDKKFKKPEWLSIPSRSATGGAATSAAVKGGNVDDVYCGMKNPGTVKQENFLPFPLFDAEKDGPLLREPRLVEMQTSVGPITLLLDPALAPIHATQLHRLLTKGAFNGTLMFRYVPGFVLQLESCERKNKSNERLSIEQQDMLRKLPLEIECQEKGGITHKQWSLSMARFDDKNSAVSSFSMILGDAPHLDRQYTIFGRAVPDEVTAKTLDKLFTTWAFETPWVIGAVDRGVVHPDRVTVVPSASAAVQSVHGGMAP
jgi:cyclophilin family peptidyl-prolyl cis-trans isomerase